MFTVFLSQSVPTTLRGDRLESLPEAKALVKGSVLLLSASILPDAAEEMNRAQVTFSPQAAALPGDSLVPRGRRGRGIAP